MDIGDTSDDPPDEEHIDDDVPIYEPMYPERERMCSHPICDNESPSGQRLCDECTPVMLVDAPDTCRHCERQS